MLKTKVRSLPCVFSMLICSGAYILSMSTLPLPQFGDSLHLGVFHVHWMVSSSLRQGKRPYLVMIAQLPAQWLAQKMFLN